MRDGGLEEASAAVGSFQTKRAKEEKQKRGEREREERGLESKPSQADFGMDARERRDGKRDGMTATTE